VRHWGDIYICYIIGVRCYPAPVIRRGFKWIFRYGEPETVPLPSRLWLFGMYVVM
jgi:hypothetical protein